MTVGDWIAQSAPAPPETLRARILSILGPDGSQPAGRTADVCLAAAARLLRELVAEQRFERDSAEDLLAVDALMTYAFEHASKAGSVTELAALARRGEQLIGGIATDGE